jgi:Heterokaryon incompatibility protein (HET)
MDGSEMALWRQKYCTFCQPFDFTSHEAWQKYHDFWKQPENYENKPARGINWREDNIRFPVATLEYSERQPNCPACRLRRACRYDREGRSSDRGHSFFYHDQKGFISSVYDTRLLFVENSRSLYPWIPKIGRRVAQDSINMPLVKEWIDLCIRNHAVDCRPGAVHIGAVDSAATIPKLRLVDVLNDSVVDTYTDCQYLALSYVWGSAPHFRLSTSNLDTLSSPGGLRTVFSYLPRTVADAIILTKIMGFRYIWIDALCLIEDDIGDLKTGIQSMDLIYSGSYLTIVAATGDHANTGLPGVRPGTRDVMQAIEEVAPGLDMIGVEDVDDALSMSAYASRGWTYAKYPLPKHEEH